MALKKAIMVMYLIFLAVPALAIDGEAVLGGAIGGGTGAAIGSAVGGRDGAIIGGAIGGAAGAGIATSGREPTRYRHKTHQVVVDRVVEKDVVYVPDHHDNGLHRGHYKHKH
jgi:outer membrane lipoprotein SlyB